MKKPSNSKENSLYDSSVIIGDPSSEYKSEFKIENEIYSWLYEYKVLFWKIRMKLDPNISFEKKIYSDLSAILICYQGLFICLKVKKCGGICSLSQLNIQQNVRKNGGIYEFVTSVREAEQILKIGSKA